MRTPHNIAQVETFYNDWFIDYASYVILDRAIPHLKDGLKPVQRRILHSLDEMDDGRLNKVANVAGHCMRYHPHGDSSIIDAMVGIGQKGYLIDTQGNWGNIFTGHEAAAARYIEARLSKFAKEVSFNPRLTEYSPSYDGRGKEPVTLPMKFPLLLAQGAEGIAVGLACSILPHNFIELCDSCIAHLEGRPFTLYPDFPTGGIADVRNYNDGARGGRVKVRAKIEREGKDSLVIHDLPYGVTGPKLMESVEKAVENNKIRIKNISDNTAKAVRIVVSLGGADPDVTRDALYAFTACEVSLAPNACVITDGKPKFLGVTEMLRASSDQTRDLIKKELEMRLADLREDWHRMTLEQLFIANKVYDSFDKTDDWEAVIAATLVTMQAFRNKLQRDLTEEDVVRLTELQFKRITKFDTKKALDLIAKNEADQAVVVDKLSRISEVTVEYFAGLKKRYGEGRERKTELSEFGTVNAASVAASNVKLYLNKEEGFVGHGMKKDEFVCDCSDIDDVLAIGADGWMKVNRIAGKTFYGANILYAGIWRKNDARVYNLAYCDGESGHVYVKRFKAGAITREKEYSLVKSPKSKILFLSVEDTEASAPKINVQLKKGQGARKTDFEFDFSELAIKGREAGGNRLTKYETVAVSRI